MSGFLKPYSDRAATDEAVRRSLALRTADVSTPAILASGETTITFQKVDGQSGDLLDLEDLSILLFEVARLHQAPVKNLPRYDPFLRVRPRLAVPTTLPVSDILSEPVPNGTATLHGDLHVGQFIRGDDQKIWIVDLDDLAIGPPEADIANFAAHLATSQRSRSIRDWSGRICRAWAEIGGTLDDAVFDKFLRFALLRRHVKLREAGRPDFEKEILIYLRDSSNFSIL